ncbi:S26 family signal peptidase [Candidatus Saccharibacteria bacterium]|nr:S26 family signal peptidase [Candidatus Saccharibacteria bacterium]
MHPTLKPGQLVLFTKSRRPKVGDIVMVRHGGIEKVKRILEIRGDELFLIGDNVSASKDSRHFGWVKQQEIVGRLRWPLARKRIT